MEFIPYMLVIATNKWAGNFARELVGYCTGILDREQMDIGYADEERDVFWKEEFPGKFNEAPELSDFSVGVYGLYDDYLLETYQEVDDWEQSTFYNIYGMKVEDVEEFCSDAPVAGEVDSVVYIQLQKPLDEKWEEMITRRIRSFVDSWEFDFKPKNMKLTGLRLYKMPENVVSGKPEMVKDYMSN